MQNLIIIRGNSGSGKSSVAKKVHTKMGEGTMLVPQDIIRREILNTQDNPGNPSIQLIYELAMYGKNIGYDVIIEGILRKDKYGEMLSRLIDDFGGHTMSYYFDIPFEETLRRNNLKANRAEFTEEEFRRWWAEKDYLNIPGEKYITEATQEDAIVEMMYKDLT